MLKAGIVGLKNSTTYVNILQNLDSYSFVGLYDPAFQVDLNLFRTIDRGVLDFSELVNGCDLIIFSADDKVFFPLIKEVILHSKTVFLDSYNKYNYDQLKILAKLSAEANCSVHVLHPQLFHEVYIAYQALNPHPFVISSEVNIEKPELLLLELRKEVTNLLYLINFSIRKVSVNIASTKGQIPDVYTLNFEFNNGCNCRLVVSSLNMPEYRIKRIVGMDAHYELDFIQHKYTFFEKGQGSFKQVDLEKNTFELLVTKQLSALYEGLINNDLFCESLVHEMETSKVLEKVTDKLKLCMSIV